MIELHSSPTPNGQKVMIMLEELGIEWKHFDVNIRLGEQFTPDFLKLSPNNRIPTIVDTDGPGGGRYTMMESGAILWYLAEKTGKFLPKDARKRYDTLQWLIFQMAHVGPMFGQANHFNNYAKDNDPVPEGSLQQRVGPPVSRARQPRPRERVDGLRRIHGGRHGDLPVDEGAQGSRRRPRPSTRTSCAGSRRWRRVPPCSATTRWRPRSASA